MSTESASPFRVTSEDDALALLKSALDGDLPDASSTSIVWDGWPLVNIHLPNTPVEGSISPTMMAAFIELQESIYRSQALINTKSSDLRGFTQVEKDALEFRVEVKKGSSDYLANLAGSVGTIAEGLVNKMNATESFVAVLTIAVLLAGNKCLEAWLKERADKRKDESKSLETKQYLDAQKELMAHDERQTEVMIRAFRERPILEQVQHVIEPARQSLVQAIGDEKGGSFQGVGLTPRFTSEIATQHRQKSSIDEISGAFRVAFVDTTASDGFKVTFINLSDGEQFSANLQDILISDQYRTVIREAEWSKQPVEATFTVKKLRGKIVEATVREVKGANKPRSVS